MAHQNSLPAGRLWVDLEAPWALGRGLQPAVTCKRTWDSTGGNRRDFMLGCTRAAAALSSCRVDPASGSRST